MKLKAKFKKFRQLKSGELIVTFEVKDLSQDQIIQLANSHNLPGWLLWDQSESAKIFEQWDNDLQDRYDREREILPEFYSHSQRLRFVFYDAWMKNPEGILDPSEYYITKMNSLIISLKKRIENM
jgi:hypothetical protein